ncbi:uncharacterized protein LACBIDRAFT_308313 [Laccaria bicolor S238N-H82]|uniref:Predicted protein n=1 Tax=Laccaria bicolor (strain S238N-H82 / ATCC MYA-4686) TaxID=486041 RepID=B0DS27_LACBS|nr:uncharacterized protein LACBIDRAFT_308313 [Laccaria bicolor S238N-H82]EDR02626.1 predicted protein [Laccaria bicolor S238N-H82]|eukprot:XP_001886670.1 predicted protein [Laccaria bicolor S238N-H82]
MSTPDVSYVGLEGIPYVTHFTDIELPSTLKLPYTDVELQTPDNVVLRCFLIRQAQLSSSFATVIMFHGNGMNHGDVLEAAHEFYILGCNVLTVSYRGYGNSTGSPSEKGLKIDAQTALDHILSDPSLSNIPIIIFGQSLGGAVAIDLASRNYSKVSALIIENTFTSLPDVIRGWPYIGVFSFLCTQKWKSASKIPWIPPTLPILMLSSLLDEVIPEKHMRNLWKIASVRGKPKSAGWWRKARPVETWVPPQKDLFQSFPNGHHTDTYIQEGYWKGVQEFFDNLNLRKPKSQPSTSHESA